jgi:di/tricarboxylate transporter
VYWTAFTYHLFLASELSMLGTSVPVLMNYATAHHLDPLKLGMIWTFACSGKIFMYQSAVLVVGYSFGYFKSKDLFRLGLCMSIVDSVLLLLVVPFYWPLAGIG